VSFAPRGSSPDAAIWTVAFASELVALSGKRTPAPVSAATRKWSTRIGAVQTIALESARAGGSPSRTAAVAARRAGRNTRFGGIARFSVNE
jgi:hypothetical protein